MSITAICEDRSERKSSRGAPITRLRLRTREVLESGNISRHIGIHLSLHTHDELAEGCKGLLERSNMHIIRVDLNTTFWQLHNLIAGCAFGMFGMRPHNFPHGRLPGESFGKVVVKLEDDGCVEVSEQNWNRLQYLLIEEDETAHFEAWFVIVPPVLTHEARRKRARVQAMSVGGPRFKRLTVPDVSTLASERRDLGLWGWWRQLRVPSV